MHACIIAYKHMHTDYGWMCTLCSALSYPHRSWRWESSNHHQTHSTQQRKSLGRVHGLLLRFEDWSDGGTDLGYRHSHQQPWLQQPQHHHLRWLRQAAWQEPTSSGIRHLERRRQGEVRYTRTQTEWDWLLWRDSESLVDRIWRSEGQVSGTGRWTDEAPPMRMARMTMIPNYGSTFPWLRSLLRRVHYFDGSRHWCLTDFRSLTGKHDSFDCRFPHQEHSSSKEHSPIVHVLARATSFNLYSFYYNSI